MGILSLIYDFCREGDAMGTVLGKECYVLHIEKGEDGVCVEWIDFGKIRYGDYKVCIYKDNELYFKDSIENIYVKRFGNVVLVGTRDNKHRFEIIVKNNPVNDEIVDLCMINNLMNKNWQ